LKTNKEQTKITSENTDTLERLMIEFVMGTRVPVTEFEKKLYSEINEIKRMGHIVEIPFDI
jgi:hypothetical protein